MCGRVEGSVLMDGFLFWRFEVACCSSGVAACLNRDSSVVRRIIDAEKASAEIEKVERRRLSHHAPMCERHTGESCKADGVRNLDDISQVRTCDQGVRIYGRIQVRGGNKVIGCIISVRKATEKPIPRYLYIRKARKSA